MDIYETHLGSFKAAQVKAILSDITCGENCWSAKEDICRCECGGKNHGIHLRGENAVRACRINGTRYELLSVGKYRDLQTQCEQLIRDSDVEQGRRTIIGGEYHAISSHYRVDSNRPKWFKTSYVHPSTYNRGGGSYALKYASLPQCLKWRELEYAQIANDRDRYHADIGILWKRADLIL